MLRPPRDSSALFAWSKLLMWKTISRHEKVKKGNSSNTNLHSCRNAAVTMRTRRSKPHWESSLEILPLPSDGIQITQYKSCLKFGAGHDSGLRVQAITMI